MSHWSSAEMRAAAQAANPSLYSALDLTLEDHTGTETTYRFASAGGLPGATYPGAAPRVIDWGPPVKSGFDLTSATIGRSDATVTLDDKDGSIRSRLGAGNNRLASAILRYVSPGSADVSEMVLNGILDTWHPTLGKTELRLRIDDRALDVQVPKLPLLRPDWPDLTGATAANYGIYFPVVMGTHSALGLIGAGALKCFPVAWTTGSVGWYTPMLGPASTIDRVYVAGVLKTLTTHYTIALETRGLKAVTVIKFTAGNIPTESQAVTCDASGADSAGTALGGVVVTNPVRQLRKFLIDHGWGTWKAGAYPSASPTTTMLDDELWSDSIALGDVLKLEGVIYEGGTTRQRKLRDMLEEWGQTYRRFKLFWTRAGLLGIRSIDLTHPGYRSEVEAAYAAGTYRHEPAVFRGYHELEALSTLPPDAGKIIDRASAAHLFTHTTGSAESQAQFEVYDHTTGEDASDSFTMLHSPARAV